MLRSRHMILRDDVKCKKLGKLEQNMGHGNGVQVHVSASQHGLIYLSRVRRLIIFCELSYYELHFFIRTRGSFLLKI